VDLLSQKTERPRRSGCSGVAMPAKTSSQKNCRTPDKGELLQMQKRNFNNWS
jgi:hypothetical protein